MSINRLKADYEEIKSNIDSLRAELTSNPINSARRKQIEAQLINYNNRLKGIMQKLEVYGKEGKIIRVSISFWDSKGDIQDTWIHYPGTVLETEIPELVGRDLGLRDFIIKGIAEINYGQPL